MFSPSVSFISCNSLPVHSNILMGLQTYVQSDLTGTFQCPKHERIKAVNDIEDTLTFNSYLNFICTCPCIVDICGEVYVPQSPDALWLGWEEWRNGTVKFKMRSSLLNTSSSTDSTVSFPEDQWDAVVTSNPLPPKKQLRHFIGTCGFHPNPLTQCAEFVATYRPMLKKMH
jgi:hypothetical protein